MSKITINKINTTDSILFNTKNNEIDSTGRINEKIQKNKFNYIVNEIKNELPDASSSPDKLVFIYDEENDKYTLYNKVNNSNSSYSYNQFDVPISSTLLITSTKDIFTLYNIEIVLGGNNKQIWEKIDNLNKIKNIKILEKEIYDKDSKYRINTNELYTRNYGNFLIYDDDNNKIFVLKDNNDNIINGVFVKNDTEYYDYEGNVIIFKSTDSITQIDNYLYAYTNGTDTINLKLLEYEGKEFLVNYLGEPIILNDLTYLLIIRDENQNILRFTDYFNISNPINPTAYNTYIIDEEYNILNKYKSGSGQEPTTYKVYVSKQILYSENNNDINYYGNVNISYVNDNGDEIYIKNNALIDKNNNIIQEFTDEGSYTYTYDNTSNSYKRNDYTLTLYNRYYIITEHTGSDNFKLNKTIQIEEDGIMISYNLKINDNYYKDINDNEIFLENNYIKDDKDNIIEYIDIDNIYKDCYLYPDTSKLYAVNNTDNINVDGGSIHGIIPEKRKDKKYELETNCKTKFNEGEINEELEDNTNLITEGFLNKNKPGQITNSIIHTWDNQRFKVNSEIFNCDKNIALDECSHAEGYETQAVGRCSHAEGKGTVACGKFAHAGGQGSIARGDICMAVGNYTVAQNTAMFACGDSNTLENDKQSRYMNLDNNNKDIDDYNVSSNKGRKIFVVGNGKNNLSSSEQTEGKPEGFNRRDAFKVFWSGNAALQHNLSLESITIKKPTGETDEYGHYLYNYKQINDFIQLDNDTSDDNYYLYSGAKINNLLSNISPESITLPINPTPEPIDDEFY